LCVDNLESRAQAVSCVGRCSSACDLRSGLAISDRYGRMTSPRGIPCDNGGGLAVHEWHGVTLQDFCNTLRCPANQDGAYAIIYNSRLNRAYTVGERYWTTYRCLRDGAGPRLLGAPVEDVQTLPQVVPIVSRQTFENGYMWWGPGPSCRTLNPPASVCMHVHLPAGTRFALDSSCSGLAAVENSPGPEGCDPGEACRPGDSICTSASTRSFCGTGFTGTDCPSFSPDMACSGSCDLTTGVCEGMIPSSCGREGLPCCGSEPRCYLGTACTSGVCRIHTSGDAGPPIDAPLDATADVGNCECTPSPSAIPRCDSSNRRVFIDCMPVDGRPGCGRWASPRACSGSDQCVDGFGCRSCGGLDDACCPEGPSCTGGRVCVGAGSAARCRTPGIDAGPPCMDECSRPGEYVCTSPGRAQYCATPTLTQNCNHFSTDNVCTAREICQAGLAGRPDTGCVSCGNTGQPCCAGNICDGRSCQPDGRCGSAPCLSGQIRCTSCIDPTSDPRHCGACGNMCSDGINGTALCRASTCTLACRGAYSDCDRDLSNGCERDLFSDLDNCGSCGRRCSTVHAVPVCTLGNCRLTCTSGFGNCNGDVSDGCETDLSSNASNCGMCGNACTSEQVCSAGSCTTSCGGSAPTNCSGTCANLDTDPMNCGMCGRSCSRPANTRATCSSGMCGFVCDPGFANCNSISADGCERDTRSDPSHCSACGQACDRPPTARCASPTSLETFAPMGTCESGTCIYSSTTRACSGGCVGGVCTDDPCAGITCTSPTPPVCMGSTLRRYTSPGTCTAGRCTYMAVDRACTFGCVSGACLPDPCAGVSCTSPPPSRCLDTNTIEESEATGTCSGGSCTYRRTTRTCGFGCASGRCAGDPCDGVTCTIPSAPVCASSTTVRSFSLPGMCTGGSCGYTQSDRTCSLPNATSSCSGGRCVVSSCATGFADCDGDAGNGCEVDTRSDAIRCGGCFTACSFPNAVPACSSGTCMIASCLSGYHLCSPSCVSNLSPSSCGSSCAPCSAPMNGTATCNGTTCGFTCNTGYAPSGSVCVSTAPLELALGYWHTCLRRASGEAQCWGRGEHGELGRASFSVSVNPTPRAVMMVSDATGIAAGGRSDAFAGHSCALRSSGAVVCWGGNAYGQLGDGTTMASSLPAPVFGLTDAVEVATGDYHTCARRRDGTVVCWGANGSGQLGNNTTTPSVTPVAVVGLTDAVEVVAADTFTCARRATGGVVCWGRNDVGQLGNGTTTGSRVPVAVTGLTDAVEVTVGGNGFTVDLTSHACARRASGSVVCWGANNYGQLGDGTRATRSIPAAVTGLTDAIEVSAGGSHVCARRASNNVVCWGGGGSGQLGIGPGSSALTPTTVPLTSVAQVSAGGEHTCARQTGGQVYCWGGNAYGQLGDGTSTDRRLPTLVTGL
jgi:alpha-tubulin suppressor-like RCC1 family protein